MALITVKKDTVASGQMLELYVEHGKTFSFWVTFLYQYSF